MFLLQITITITLTVQNGDCALIPPGHGGGQNSRSASFGPHLGIFGDRWMDRHSIGAGLGTSKYALQSHTVDAVPYLVAVGVDRPESPEQGVPQSKSLKPAGYTNGHHPVRDCACRGAARTHILFFVAKVGSP